VFKTIYLLIQILINDGNIFHKTDLKFSFNNERDVFETYENEKKEENNVFVENNNVENDSSVENIKNNNNNIEREYNKD